MQLHDLPSSCRTLAIRCSGMALAAVAWMFVLSGVSMAQAQEVVIRKNLAENIPTIGKIEEVRQTQFSGLYELRMNGAEIAYTDAQGSYLLLGSLIDAKSQHNLTKDRVEKLTAIDFKSLPVKDSFTIVRGNGKRQLALFADPNCGYCKHLERDLASVSDITVHLYLLPILGADSLAKAKSIWCAKDSGAVWQDWMLREIKPTSVSDCDTTAITRNVEFAKKFKIPASPTLVFADNSRVVGAINATLIETKL